MKRKASMSIHQNKKKKIGWQTANKKQLLLVFTRRNDDSAFEHREQ